MFADVDLRRVAAACQVDDYPGGLGRMLGGSQPGSWLYTGALENHPELISRWQGIRPLLGNSAEVLRLVRNPAMVSAVLRNAGLAAPLVRLEGANLPRDGTWLRKPRRSAGGARIARLDAEGHDPAKSDEFYFQQQIEGTSVSAVYVATAREVRLIGVTEQLCGTRWGGDTEFRYCGSIGPRPLAPQIMNQFQRIGETLHQSFALLGLFGVDAILQDGVVWPVEVNPRYTASVEVIERAAAFNAVASHVSACRKGELPELSTPRQQSGKLIVWAVRKCLFPAHGDLPAGLRACPSTPALADIPAADTPIEAGWPIATVLADAGCPEAVIEQLANRAAALQTSCLPA
jgi:predicted ATP-grasp superfamily ATP-dependent carboligase